MALVGEKFAFFHMPRTGGTWVRHALRIADPACEEIGPSHCLPGDIRYTPGKLRFTVLRDPADWLASWQRLLATQREHLSEGIPDVFLANDLADRVAEVYGYYRQDVDLVLATEFLDTELPQFLTDLGYDGNEVVARVPAGARNRLET